MHLKNFNLILMLIAGIIVGIISIISNYTMERLMFTLLIVLIVFYVIGTIIQVVVNRIFDATDQEERKKEIAKLDEEEKELALEGDNGEMTEEQQQ